MGSIRKKKCHFEQDKNSYFPKQVCHVEKKKCSKKNFVKYIHYIIHLQPYNIVETVFANQKIEQILRFQYLVTSFFYIIR